MSSTAIEVAGTNFLALDRPDRFWQEMMQAGKWEPATNDALAQLSPGDLFVDIGAWVGATALPAAARGARVIAFEPDPVARQELEANVALNNFGDRVTVEPVALASKTSTRKLTAPYQLGDTMSSIARISRADKDSNRAVDVAAVDVREYLPRFAGARLVKIDIEGGEYALLPAMRGWLRQERPDLMLSLHTYYLAGLTNRLPGFVRPAALAAATVGLRGRIRWLASIYEHRAMVASGKWRPLTSGHLGRQFATPGEQELYLSTRPLNI